MVTTETTPIETVETPTPYDREILRLANELAVEKWKQKIYRFLLDELDTVERCAKMTCDVCNWNYILDSKQFDLDEKYRFSLLLNEMRQDLDDWSARRILNVMKAFETPVNDFTGIEE